MPLDKDWQPSFGTIFTWFAMDRHGRIAVMVNNCFGPIPSSLLAIPELEKKLDSINEFMWEESREFQSYPKNKEGQTLLDIYRFRRHLKPSSRDEMERIVLESSNFYQELTEYSLPSIKGLYVYHALEDYVSSEDNPIGYEGDAEIGDYFRYLIPTACASIEDFPEELRSLIAVSDTLDFTVDRAIFSMSINQSFKRSFNQQT